MYNIHFALLGLLLLLCNSRGSTPGEINFNTLFRQIQTTPYIPKMQDGNGIAFRDINGDELPDIYMVCFRGENRLLINSGAYRPFKDVTDLSGLSGNLRPGGFYNLALDSTIYDLKLSTSLVDVDNDGDNDVLIAGWGISTSLYLNEGDLKFKNITNQLEIFPPIDANSCIAADINNDGFVDFFLTDEYRSNWMLMNLGDNFFKDITSVSGLQFVGNSKGAGFCDIDNDNDQDLYVTSWNQPDVFYRNRGNGIFVKMNLPIEVCQRKIFTNGVSFGDIDNDADFDLFVTNDKGPDHLYLNETSSGDSNWVFRQVDFADSGKSFGSIIADFNNDGWQDIFVTKYGPNILYLHQGNNSYKKLIAEPPTRNKYSNGAACADYDLDGDLDLFVANKDTLSLFYQNFSNDSSFIKFKIRGIRSNRDALGSRIELYRAGYLEQRDYLLGSRQILGGSGYYSQNDLVVHFGLDTVRMVDAKIYFTSGKIVIETELRAGQTYDIVEYSLLMRTFILSVKHMLNLMRQSEFWYQILLVLLFFILTILLIRLGLKRYRWSSGTASGYLAGFFLMALIAIVALKKLGLLYIFATINIMTIIFVTTFIINSERLYRLRKIRERYRSVLINLSNQIVNIHDDNELCKTVVDNIHQITEFDAIAILTTHKNEKSFSGSTSRGLQIDLHSLNSQSGFSEFINTIKEMKHIQKSADKKFDFYFNIINSDVFISIERDDRLYGILSIGAHEKVSPLSREDVDLFKTIANQMAIALENNEYIRRSTEMIKKLTEAEVREKYLKELEATNAILDTKNRDLQKLYDELKNTQAQLIHSEKMASLGQLVAGISHELNNPIGFIYSNIKQLKNYTHRIESFINEIADRTLPSESERQFKGKRVKSLQIQEILPDIKNLIDDTISGSQMIKELVENLRRFSHLDQAKWKTFDIHEGIESSLKILLPQFKQHVAIHKSYKADGFVDCNPGQINQVFLNLLSNAAQAIKNEGNIWIETENDKEHILIRFKDDGVGMSQAILNKIFDPFFTTKDVGEGTGLGLSISYSIIQNHGGNIEAQSTEGKGSVFTVILPQSN